MLVCIAWTLWVLAVLPVSLALLLAGCGNALVEWRSHVECYQEVILTHPDSSSCAEQGLSCALP